MKEFITVAVYTYPHEYLVLKNLLEEEGIPHIFENEMIVSISPFYSNALGGIKLKVHPHFAEEVTWMIRKLEDPDSPLRIV